MSDENAAYCQSMCCQGDDMARDQGTTGLSGQRLPAAEAGPGSSPYPDHETTAADTHAGFSQRLARSPFGSFIPWILFWVIGGPSTWRTASIAALLAAVLLTLLSIRRPDYYAQRRRGRGGEDFLASHDLSRIKVLDAATVVFFAILLVISSVLSQHSVNQVDKYAQALSSGALGAIALGSILFRHPFTIDYAKESTPPEVWRTAIFKHINLVLTWVWAIVFLVCGALGLLSVHVGTKGLQDLLNWYIPIALIILGIELNSWYPHRVRERLQAQGGQPGLRT
jgi:hypothetical protein